VFVEEGLALLCEAVELPGISLPALIVVEWDFLTMPASISFWMCF